MAAVHALDFDLGKPGKLKEQGILKAAVEGAREQLVLCEPIHSRELLEKFLT